MSSVEDFERKIIKSLQLPFLKHLYKDFSVYNFSLAYLRASKQPCSYHKQQLYAAEFALMRW